MSETIPLKLDKSRHCMVNESEMKQEARMDAAQERTVYIDIETAGLEFWRPIIQIAAIAVDSELNELESIELKIHFRRVACRPTGPIGQQV